MRKKIIALGAVVAAFVAVALVALSQSASATGDEQQCTIEECNPGWYVNPDEENLRPEQKPNGLLFDGPSLIHHAAAGKLADLQPGSFTADVTVGVAPLFKVETTAPYSTLNYVGPGNLWWSSKIAAGVDGGQGKPQTPEWFTTHTPYTADTVLLSFGVGYANDAGNTALVKTITFAGESYDMACPTPPTTTTTTTGSSTSSTTTTTETSDTSSSSSSATTTDSSSSATSTTTSNPAVGHVGNESPIDVGTVGEKGLAYTGTSDQLPIILWIGILAVVAGLVLIFVYRRRSSRSGDHRS